MKGFSLPFLLKFSHLVLNN